MILLRWLLIIAVVVFAVIYFARMWEPMQASLQNMQAWRVTLSFFALLIGLGFNVLSWTTVLHGMGHEVPFVRAAQIMLVGQLGKYVPGSVWAYVLQMEIGRQHGVARARVLVSSLYTAGIGVVSSLILAAFALPQISAGHPELLWLFALLPVGLACLHPAIMTLFANTALKMFRRPALEHRVRFATVALAVGWCVASYLTYGLHLWLLADGVPIGDVFLMAAAISLGFTAGLFAFLLPSGVGVREAVLIAILALMMPIGDASAISLVSRGMFTLGDLLTAGGAALAALIMHRRLHRTDVQTAEYSDISAESL